MCIESIVEVNDNIFILMHDFKDDSRKVINEDKTVLLSIDCCLVVRNGEGKYLGSLQYMNGEYEYRTEKESTKTGAKGEIGYRTILDAEIFVVKHVLQ